MSGVPSFFKNWGASSSILNSLLKQNAVALASPGTAVSMTQWRYPDNTSRTIYMSFKTAPYLFANQRKWSNILLLPVMLSVMPFSSNREPM